jgi:hypothetical protein
MNEKIKWFNTGFLFGLTVPLILAVLWHNRDQREIANAQDVIAGLREQQRVVDGRYRALERNHLELGTALEDARGYIERIESRLRSGAGNYREAVELIEEIVEDIEGFEMVVNRGPARGGGPDGGYNVPP